MNWKDQLETFENNKQWKPAVDLMEEIIRNNPNDVEAYVRGMYLLWDILLEQGCEPHEQDYTAQGLDVDYMWNLLKRYYIEATRTFAENAEYLFFIGYFTHIAEWYWGLKETDPATAMQKKAMELEPDNILYEWSYKWSITPRGESSSDNAKRVKDLVEKMVKYDLSKIEWLNTKGRPGKYIIRTIKARYKELANPIK